MVSLTDLPFDILTEILSTFKLNIRLMLVHRCFAEALERRRYHFISCYGPGAAEARDKGNAELLNSFRDRGVLERLYSDDDTVKVARRNIHGNLVRDTTKIHLLLRSLVTRPDLAASVHTLRLFAEEHPLRPEYLNAFSIVELERLKTLEEWDGIQLGDMTSFVRAIFRLSNPAELTANKWVLRSLGETFANHFDKLNIKSICCAQHVYENSRFEVAVDISASLDEVLRSKLNILRVWGVRKSYLESASLRTLDLESSSVRVFKFSSLVHFTYYPETSFPIKELLECLMLCRNTLKSIHINLFHLPEMSKWHGGTASFRDFTMLKFLWLSIPLLSMPYFQSVPPNLTDFDVTEHWDPDIEPSDIFDELAPCLNAELTQAILYACSADEPSYGRPLPSGTEVEYIDEHGEQYWILRRKPSSF